MVVDTGSQRGSLTVADFSALPEEEAFRLELSRGRLVREPAPGPRHGHTVARIVEILQRFGEGAGLSLVETGFTIDPGAATVRVPDVAFVLNETIPGEGLTDRFWELAPDLAVEVVSPSNSASEIQRKALEYLDAGTRVVWVVDPAGATVTVYRSRSDIRILAGDELLSGEDVLPDLRVPVSELFSGI